MKKGTRKKSEKMEKRGKEDKQGRQDALASQHALTSAFISAEHPLTRGRSPWHTAFTNAVCVWQWMTKNKSQVKTQTNHTHSAFGLCLVCVSERQMDAQTIRSVKGVRRVIDKTTRQDLSSHDGKAVHIHSTSVVFGASGHLWCHEERCANTTRHCHACLHRLHCSCFSKVCYPVCCVL